MPSWGHLGAMLGHLGGILNHLGAVLEHLGTMLDHLAALLGHFGEISIFVLFSGRGARFQVVSMIITGKSFFVKQNRPTHPRSHFGSQETLSKSMRNAVRKFAVASLN